MVLATDAVAFSVAPYKGFIPPIVKAYGCWPTSKYATVPALVIFGIDHSTFKSCDFVDLPFFRAYHSHRMQG